MTAPPDPLDFLKTTGLSGHFLADSPMSRLAADIYALLEPYTEVDAANGYALRTIVEGIAKTLTDLDEIVREGPNGQTRWSSIMDATRCPPEGLAWLGQIVGTRLIPGDTLDTHRARVGAADGLRRGSPAQMTLAAQRLLTGNKTVFISERTSDAWHFSVRTRTSETPSSAAVLAALTAAKPAGLILDYATFTGILYQESLANQATYTLSTAAKATYTLRGA